MDTMEYLEIAVGICLGISLAAACGFRVFVPMLGISIAHKLDLISLSEGFSWIGTWPALAAFSIATVMEVAAYYIPWVDNLLDMVTVPSAFVAGVIASAAAMSDTEISPLLMWGVALVGGGGSASVVGGTTTVVRGTSSAVTGGLGNSVVSTGELIASAVVSVFAFFLPILTALVMVLFVISGAYYVLRYMKRRREAKSAKEAATLTKLTDKPLKEPVSS